MKVLMVSAEAAPFVRTSDVATIVTDLCVALRELGEDVRLVIPFYRRLACVENARQVLGDMVVRLGNYHRLANVWRVDHRRDSGISVPVYLIEDAFYFSREHPYGYMDDYERFIFFTRAALAMVDTDSWKNSEDSWRPDIIHGHDWIAGLVPFWLRASRATSAPTPRAAFAYTLHNAGFPGQFGRRALQVAGLEEFGIYQHLGERPGTVNFMIRGIWAADAVNTVSPAHAKELGSGHYADQIQLALSSRASPLSGILNGIDYATYNPAFDSRLAQSFDAFTLHKRQKNKLHLQISHGLDVDGGAVLVGMVSRLIAEKGLGLLEEVIPELLNDRGVQIVVLGALGDYQYQEALERLAHQFHGRMVALFGFDEQKAREIFAASDILAIPSLHEPCGLQPMIAMRYGAIPLIRKTGGLGDTVADWREDSVMGRGFVFEETSAQALLLAIRSAVGLFRSDPRQWNELQRHNMSLDLSWHKPAAKYLDLYGDAIATSRVQLALESGKAVPPNRSQMLVHALLEVNDLATAAGEQEFLQQSARILRELLGCDGVLIWTEDEAAPFRLRLKGSSFSESSRTSEVEVPNLVRADLGMRSWGPQYNYRQEAKSGDLKGQSGLLHSKIAIAHGWQLQVSVPMSTRGVVGRIDVFFREDERVISEEDTSVLTAVASVLARNLDHLDTCRLAEQLQVAAKTMANATTLRETADKALDSAGMILRIHGAELRVGTQTYSWLGHSSSESASTPDLGTSFQEIPDHLQSQCSTLELDLCSTEERLDVQLRVWRYQYGGFSARDERALEALARQVETALQVTQRREQTDRTRVEKLRRLSEGLTGISGLEALLDSIVKITADVLEVEAASLYIVHDSNPERDDDNGPARFEGSGSNGEYLDIEAADGYNKVQLGKGYRYRKGEGLIGHIWEYGETVKVDSLVDLHNHPWWQGKYTGQQNGREPNCYLGIPLKVSGSQAGRDKVIGVLELEDRRVGAPPKFDEEDQRLGEMMANVSATAVYNTQLARKSLNEFSTNITKLSGALAGSENRQKLMDNIVDTIANVVRVDAASLYLADAERKRLEIEAASGYQKGLTTAIPRPFYEWGDGVTGRIAKENRSFRSDSLKALRDRTGSGSNDMGRWDHLTDYQRPESFYGLPLNVQGEDRPIGVLKVESLKRRPFTAEDTLLLVMMGNVIAAVVYNVQVSERKLAKFSSDLRELSIVLSGSQGRQKLMDNIVDTIATVVGVDAASLYLADSKREQLAIVAAHGYQKALTKQAVRPFYRWGEGVTGMIAQANKAIEADSVDSLRKLTAGVSGGKGRWDHLTGNKRPESFYGLPLNVQGESKPIGVLKVERLKPRPFTAEDKLLVQMMGNVIAAVVYNIQISEGKLETLSRHLQRLSEVLTPGEGDWFQTIVETISDVSNTDAASLYLFDESTKRLIIAAASGYQKPLIKAKAGYGLDEGITGRIFKSGAILAGDLGELRSKGAGSGKRGKYDYLQRYERPESFYGVPLMVPGAKRAIGVLKFESLKRQFFSKETCLLIDMMANLIATVIQNTQRGEERLGAVLRKALATPLNTPFDLSDYYAQERDSGLISQLARALTEKWGDVPEELDLEAETIFDERSHLGREQRSIVFDRIADWANSMAYDQLEYRARLYGAVLQQPVESWNEVAQLAAPWIRLRDGRADIAAFGGIAGGIVETFAERIDLRVSALTADPTGSWYACVLETEAVFGEQVRSILLLFKRQSGFEEEGPRLEVLARQDTSHSHPVLLVIAWSTGYTQTQMQVAREHLKTRRLDIVFVDIAEILKIMQAPTPRDELRKTVLRQVRIVSPYITHGTIPESRFVGREDEIRRLTDRPTQRDFAIIGNRRIGKSSLLNRVHSLLSSNRDILPIKLDLQAVRNQHDFFDLFAAQTFSNLPEQSPRGFATCVRALRAKGHIPVFLIDEVDALLAAEEDLEYSESLVRQWRSLAQETERKCCFLFFGCENLARQVNNRDSMMHNFGEPLYLGCLPAQDARRVLLDPLDHLDVDLDDRSEITESVLGCTSGHPCLVQLMGDKLVEAANARDDRRVLLQDVQDLRTSADLLREFFDTLLGSVGPLERLVVLLAPDHDFDEHHVEGALAAQGIAVSGDGSKDVTLGHADKHTSLVISTQQLDESFRLLVSLSLIREAARAYRFVPTSLRMILHGMRKRDVSFYINSARCELDKTKQSEGQ